MITIPDGLKVGDRVEVTITGNVGMVHKGGVNVGPLCVLANDDRWAEVVVKKVEHPLPTVPGSVVRANHINTDILNPQSFILGDSGLWIDQQGLDWPHVVNVTVLYDAGAK